jgi:hypothetical protein
MYFLMTFPTLRGDVSSKSWTSAGTQTPAALHPIAQFFVDRYGRGLT